MPISNILFFLFNDFYFSLHFLNNGDGRTPLWTLDRRLHLAPLLCTLPGHSSHIWTCVGPRLPWATTTPAHVQGTGSYFSTSGTQGGNYTFFLPTHFSECLYLSVSMHALGVDTYLDQLRFSLLQEVPSVSFTLWQNTLLSSETL